MVGVGEKVRDDVTVFVRDRVVRVRDGVTVVVPVWVTVWDRVTVEVRVDGDGVVDAV